MIKYDATIIIDGRITPLEISYHKLDNSIETARMVVDTIREQMKAVECTKLNEERDCCSLREIKGTIERTILKYEIYDFTGRGIRDFVFWVNKYVNSYPIAMAYTANIMTLGAYT
jgi:hypothetical protein